MDKLPDKKMEQELRRSRPEPVSDAFRERIVGIFESPPAVQCPPDKLVRLTMRSWIAAAAVLALLLGLTAMFRFQATPEARVATHVPSVTVASAPVRNLLPTQLTSLQIGSRPVSPVMMSQNKPVRLMKNEHLDQLDMHDPSTGKNISITYPKTDYQLVPCSIQ